MSLNEIGEGGGSKDNAWTTSPEYQQPGLTTTSSKFLEISDLLLERPNLNSSYLFRADIIHDSSGILQTTLEKEHRHGIARPAPSAQSDHDLTSNLPVLEFADFILDRTVIRRLIPRSPNIDEPLNQACFLFSSTSSSQSVSKKHLMVYKPLHASTQTLPWYHPQVQALAYLFEEGCSTCQISIHYKPLRNEPMNPPMRLHRTMLSLLQTIVRLMKLEVPLNESASNLVSARPITPSALKDTILPQHLVQDTYTRLKQTYATDLISRWVEKTEPSKHVFEDLSIAAFLIELWKQMYDNMDFPGFIDFACGNGVLVYVLIKEGYHGYGYDARRRKTWQVLDLSDKLEECFCVPRPFLDALKLTESQLRIDLHDGLFRPGTFIISNHADELTPWTPILAYLSDPASPLPFLAIPCCSHALSGARHRYNLKDVDIGTTISGHDCKDSTEQNDDIHPASGDLRALRRDKQKTAMHLLDKSQYACLTKKVVGLAEELGFETEMTLMRIPSTRNIGIVGNRKRPLMAKIDKPQHVLSDETDQSVERDKVSVILERECARDGGIQAGATTWIEKAQKLQEGIGRGKLNLRGNLAVRVKAM